MQKWKSPRSSGAGKGSGGGSSQSSQPSPLVPPAAVGAGPEGPMGVTTPQRVQPQPDAKAIRANIAALTACLKRLPSGPASEPIKTDITEKIEAEKAKLRDTKPLKVRIEKTKAFIAKRRSRLETMEKEIVKLQEEAAIVAKTIAANEAILQEMEEILQDEEQENDDAELASFFAMALKEGSPKLVQMARDLQTRIKKEVIEIDDDDEGPLADEAELDAYSDAYFAMETGGGDASWDAPPPEATASPSTPNVRPTSGLPTPKRVAAKINSNLQGGTASKVGKKIPLETNSRSPRRQR